MGGFWEAKEELNIETVVCQGVGLGDISEGKGDVLELVGDGIGGNYFLAL